MKLPKFTFSPIWLLFTCFIFTHGLLLLNDGIYWDGWTSVYFPIADGDWERLHSLYTAYGYPIRAYLHWGVSIFGSPVLAHKVVTWLSLWLIGFFIYQVFQRLNHLSRTERLLLAIWVFTYPAYRVSVELIMMPYTLAYAAYWGGVWGLLVSQKQAGWRFWAGRLLVLAVFYFSFWIYSLLAFHYAVLLWLGLQHLRWETWRQDSWQFIRTHLDLFLLPIIFWVILQTVFKPSDYYAVDVSANPLISVLNFLQYGMYGQLAAAMNLFLLFPPLILVIGGLAWWLYPHLKDGESLALSNWIWLGVGLIWIVSAIAPYVVGGFYPLMEGWWTRHNLLLALPVGYTLICLNRLFFPQRLGLTVLAMFTLLFSVLMIDQYMNWQGRWVKDRSIITNLATQADYQDVTTFWIEDQFPVGNENRYRVHEWAAFFHQAWGGENRVGLRMEDYPLTFLLTSSQDKTYLYQSYFADWSPDGCQAVLTVQKGSRPTTYRDEWGLSVRYWAYKYLMPNKLESFLGDISTLEITRIAAPMATDCARQNELDLTWPDLDWANHLSYLNVLNKVNQSLEIRSQTEAEMRLWQNLALGVESSPEGENIQAAGFDLWWYDAYRHLLELED